MDHSGLDELDRYCDARHRSMDEGQQRERDAGLIERVTAALDHAGVDAQHLAPVVARTLHDDAVYRASVLAGPDALVRETTWARRRAIEVNQSGLSAQVSELSDLVGPLTMVQTLRPLCAAEPEPQLRM